MGADFQDYNLSLSAKIWVPFLKIKEPLGILQKDLLLHCRFHL
jgi:hypothetical protein